MRIAKRLQQLKTKLRETRYFQKLINETSTFSKAHKSTMITEKGTTLEFQTDISHSLCMIEPNKKYFGIPVLRPNT